jgi:uncharacterized repeat protein (TIGR01451 family)
MRLPYYYGHWQEKPRRRIVAKPVQAIKIYFPKMEVKLLNASHFPFRAARWGLLLVLFVALMVGVAASTSPSAAAAPPRNPSPDGIWGDVDETSFEVQGQRLIVPQQYRVVVAQPNLLQARLSAAPMEFTYAAETDNIVMSLPMPDGSYQYFRLYESPVMAPELAAKFPTIHTYTAKGIDDVYATGRLDWTPKGFHAMILSPNGTFYIDPYSQGDITHYISYYKRDFTPDENALIGELEPIAGEPALPLETLGNPSTGPTLRTHRLAVAATGEYTIFHGGTVPLAMAEIVTAVNRVTGVYEREIAIRLELIADNDDIVYVNPATDPYTNNNGFVMLAENQANLDAVIGTANYDVGHVFSTGGGGVAFLNAVCSTTNKARGVTGLTSPIGDPFYIDYVAHEMGHQYGGNHSFNGNAGACNGNRNGATAYEPGSGSTIQSYAGICGNQDLQPNSDDYFHTISFQEMVNFTTIGNGASCGTTLATGNQTPVVTVPAGGFSIPMQTPFELTGSATDPDGNPLTYNWEEYDLGPAGHPNTPVGNAPIFRSFEAVTSPTRVFPKMSDIVNNTQTIGEIMPSYARTLTFRLTARDNFDAPSAGGVAFSQMSFSVTNLAGPFLVTSPNSNVTWEVGSLKTVTWDVANTDEAPVNCTGVNIRLSVDAGYNYHLFLATNVANDGSHGVVVPNAPTALARIKVECANNVFFDISNTNFTIASAAPFADISIGKSVEPAGNVLPGDSLTYTINITNSGSLTATTTITDVFSAALVDPACNEVPGDLLVTTDLSPASITSYECVAETDSSLAVEIAKSVDQAEVEVGTAVTYTIEVTNPHDSLTLENVIVDDADVAGCTPSLGSPITLGPLDSQSYICTNNIVTTTITNTATVAGAFVVSNVASAESDQDPSGVITSNEVENMIVVQASDSVVVTIMEDSGYTLYLPVITNLPHHEGEAAVPFVLPTSLSLLVGGVVVWLNGRRKSGK